MTVAGAGMWYSLLHGAGANFTCLGTHCLFQNLSLLGETTLRDDSASVHAIKIPIEDWRWAVAWMLVFFARSGARHPVIPAGLGLLIAAWTAVLTMIAVFVFQRAGSQAS